MTPVPVITHLGLSTPFGDAEQTFHALSAGNSLALSSPCKQGESRVGALADISKYSLSRVASLALHAASPIPIPKSTPVILGTSKGEIDDWLNLRFSPHGLSNLAHVVAENLNLTQLPLIVSAACASGLVALIHACQLIQSGAEKRVLVLAAESSFHPILLHSYDRLGVLTKTTCKPFDQRRDGFFVGEAAAAILLESKLPAPGDVFIDQTALASDALSITAPDPSAIGLKSVATKLRIDEVDLIHAHGTGTVLNDAIEWQIYDALIQKPTNIYSHKAALGHTLGAAGLLAAVLTVQMMQKKQILPNPNTQNPLASKNLQISPNALSVSINKSAVIAAGFGGPIAGIRLTKKI